jgi:hypothetical protein
MDMAFMIISTTLTMILSSIHGDGDMDGHGDPGAAGMEDYGDGTIPIDGLTGDGDLDGIMDIGDIDMHGIMEDTPTEVDWVLSVTVLIGGRESELASLRMEEMPVCQEVHSEEEHLE